MPTRWHTREDSGFVIDRNVDWWHDGERIEHPNIIEAFNRGLRIAEDGQVKLDLRCLDGAAAEGSFVGQMPLLAQVVF